MITLPTGLNAFMKGQNLDGLKPFALLYRNQWDSVNNKYTLEQTPIDISALIAKPNTLSMTLDVNEVAQYNANNVTLTLSDTKNYFVEGTPNSYFPEGYQIYGSRIVLYYGTDGVNRTPLFTGVIKDLPTHKPENYQVDVKLVSPLEMLKDIEAKDLSDKFTGETLTYKSTDSDGHRIYWTTGTGVGGFDAVYANGTKLFEGVDYETDQLNALGLPAIVTIINNAYYGQTITSDYYTWKTGLTVEQIVAGLVSLAGYTSGTDDIRNVVWNTAVRNEVSANTEVAIGFYRDGDVKRFNWFPTFSNSWNNVNSPGGNNVVIRRHILPSFFETSFSIRLDSLNYSGWAGVDSGYDIGDAYINGRLQNGITFYFGSTNSYFFIGIGPWINGSQTQAHYLRFPLNASYIETQVIKVRKIGSRWLVYVGNNLIYDFSLNIQVNIDVLYGGKYGVFRLINQQWRVLDSNGTQLLPDISNPSVVSNSLSKPATNSSTWGATTATVNGQASVSCKALVSSDGAAWTLAGEYDLGANMSLSERYLKTVIEIVSNPPAGCEISNIFVSYFDTTLLLGIVNLTGKTVLEALQDFALISGYEFGVDRQGVFFFRPRVSSTTPTYILDHPEIVKVDTVKKNLSDFFTKLTLTFAQVPLEFYANTGERPTLVDKYGIINKEIDKPDIVNYDNPELAQAIGPQLLEVYSALPNIIQVTGKLNLALELGDIVSLRRNMNLITPEGYSDYSKYTDLNTYYRACKITGMNYNFSKRQITYTLRDVSNKNTEPQYEFNEYIYEYQVQFGVKE